RLVGRGVTEVRRRARLILLDAAAFPAGTDRLRAEPRAHRLQQHELQIAAMDRELRPVITGVTARRLPINELAEAVEENRLARRYRRLGESRFEAELPEHLGRVRQHVDADTNRLDLGRGLIHARGNAGSV